MKVYVEAYGCAQNLGEAHALERDLTGAGHELVGADDPADVGVLVTCGVIGPTERRMVRRWEELTVRLPSVVVTGCLVPLRTGLLTGPGRERTTFLPIREQHRLVQILGGLTGSSADGRIPALSPPSPRPPDVRSASSEVVISQGCTSACAYCFSRLARGHLTSVPMAEVVRRVIDARDRGAVEVRLTSLDTSCWGADAPSGGRLPELLDALAAVPGEFRMRVGMMSPQSLAPIADAYLGAVANERFFRFLHLPVQSGSDSVLAAMHRGYDVELFRRLVEQARHQLPDLTLSTDVIVGFPGETEEDHERTMDLLREVHPETVNVTRFSPRPGTPAARLPAVATATIARRSREAAQVRSSLSRTSKERWIGRRSTAIVVERGSRGSSVARTPNYTPVVLGDTLALGSRLEVRIHGATPGYLLGTPVEMTSSGIPAPSD